jgi:hypothetical protein
LAFGELAPVHAVFPRINDFNSEMISILVAADTKEDFMSSLDMYGIRKVQQVICCGFAFCFENGKA